MLESAPQMSTDIKAWQDVFERRNKQAIDWEEIFATPVSDKRVMSQMYHDFL